MQAILTFPDIDPNLFSISLFGMEFALRWYALAYIAGILLGGFIVQRMVRAQRLWRDDTPPMSREQVEQAMTWVILGIILGGRLGFVLFYQPGYYLQNPAQIPMLWQGGMAFHGGLIGVVLGLWLFSRRQGISKLSLADLAALATPPGLFFGRIANFINGELWGRPSTAPWAMVFPGDAAAQCPPGWDSPCPRHPSQLYEAGLEGLVLGLVLLWLALARGWLKTPGRIAGLFFAGYGAARFVVEFFRQADAQFVTPDNPAGLVLHWQGIGVTMGQLLSLPMLALGLVLLGIAQRNAAAARTAKA